MISLYLYLAEGRLHHLGEGLRRLSHSHRLAELVSHGSGDSLKRTDSGGNVGLPHRMHSGHDVGTGDKPPLSAINRIYSAPQMANMVSGLV